MDKPQKPDSAADTPTLVPEGRRESIAQTLTPPASSADTPTLVPESESAATMVPESPETMVPPSSVAGAASVAEGWAGGLQPGTVLGNRYEIIQALGEGGMGAVYKARDRELDRLVALKVIRPDLARNPAIIQRFKQELILARQVTHRNVIRIFDLGEADGIKFITMEFIEGKDLRSLLLEHKKFSPDEAVDIIRQVCLALDAAHTEGVIHRDLKPQNIMRDAQGRIVVMDFGLARSLQSDGMTQTGALIGTMEYMSPEQGLGQELDQRSDLFTLGLIFYELLSGQVPYKADSALASLLKRTQERATPVSSLENKVPKAICDMVGRCLERDPKLRYNTARELLTELDAWQGKSAAASIRLPAVQPWAQDIPWVLISVAAVVVILAVTGFLLRGKLFGPNAPARPAVAIAILPFRNGSGDASLDWLGATLADMARTDLGQSAYLHTVPPGGVDQILHDLRIAPDANFDPDTLRRVSEGTKAGQLLWGRYFKLSGRIHIDATLQDVKRQTSFTLKVEAADEKGLPQAMEQLAESVQKSLALSAETIKQIQAKSLKPSTQSLAALRQYNDGLRLGRQWKNAEAVQQFQAAIQQDPNFALAYAYLGLTYANMGNGSEAEQATRKAVDLSEKLSSAEKYLIEAIHAQAGNNTQKAIETYETLDKALPDDSDVQFALAGLYSTAGSYDKARDYYNKLLTRNPKDVETLYGIAFAEINVGNSQAALEHLNRALPLTIELGNTAEQARILYELAIAYNQLNKPEEALRDCQQALEMQRKLDNKHDLAQTLDVTAQVQDALGKSGEALKSFQEALRIRREVDDKTGLGYTLLNFSNFYEAHSENDKALPLLMESLQIQRDVGDQDTEALVLTNIGANYADKGQYDNAITYFDQGLRLREKLKNPSGIADSNYLMADALASVGQYDQAVSHYLRSLELWRGINDKRRVAFASYGLGTVFEEQGRLGPALEAESDALKTIRELQDRIGMAEMEGGYAEALILLGRGEEAQKSLEEAIALARETKNQNFLTQNLLFQGDSFYYRGDWKGARARYDEALQAASRGSDRRLALVAKFNLARLGAEEGRGREAIAALRGLSEQAGSAGLQYLSVESSVCVGQALVDGRSYPEAIQELNRALARSEKLGSRILQAKGEYWLGTALRVSGKSSDASPHYSNARRILEEVSKEAKSDTLRKRSDLAPVYRDAGKL